MNFIIHFNSSELPPPECRLEIYLPPDTYFLPSSVKKLKQITAIPSTAHDRIRHEIPREEEFVIKIILLRNTLRVIRARQKRMQLRSLPPYP